MKNVIEVATVGIFIMLLIIGADGLKRMLKAAPFILFAAVVVLSLLGKF